MQQQNFTPLYPPLQVRAGVLVVDGFGINRNRAVAVSEVHRRNREWKREHGAQPVVMRRGSGARCFRSSLGIR